MNFLSKCTDSKSSLNTLDPGYYKCKENFGYFCYKLNYSRDENSHEVYRKRHQFHKKVKAKQRKIEKLIDYALDGTACIFFTKATSYCR